MECERGGPHLISLTRGVCPCGLYVVRRVDGTEGPVDPGPVPPFADFTEPFTSIIETGWSAERWL